VVGAEYGTQFHREMQYGELLEPIKELTRGMKIYRELMFLQNLERDGEQILVQGVIDLLAVGENRALIVDYKTNNAPVEKLVEWYKPQLDMYAAAVGQAFAPKRICIYIYSTFNNKLIKV